MGSAATNALCFGYDFNGKSDIDRLPELFSKQHASEPIVQDKCGFLPLLPFAGHNRPPPPSSAKRAGPPHGDCGVLGMIAIPSLTQEHRLRVLNNDANAKPYFTATVLSSLYPFGVLCFPA